MVPALSHPGMSYEWFDKAVNRAIQDGCRASPIPDEPGWFYVTSSSSNEVYRTSRTSCSCLGHTHSARCKHVALVVFELDVMKESP